MKKIKRLVSISITSALLVGTLSLTSCGGVSEEQYAELNALRSEVTALETEVNSLTSEKTKLEREIAEMEAKLAQCAKDKAETSKNLKNLGL
jgi:chromosome segregation ATPase